MYFAYAFLLFLSQGLFCMQQDTECKQRLLAHETKLASLVASINKGAAKDPEDILIQKLAALLNEPQRKKECLQKGSYELGLDSKYLNPVAQRMIKGTYTKTFWLLRENPAMPPVSALQSSDLVNSICYSPDSTRIVTASSYGNVDIWDAQDKPGSKIRCLHHGKVGKTKAIFSHDGRQIRIAGSPELNMYASRDLSHTWKKTYPAQVRVVDIAFSSDDSLCATTRVQDPKVYLESAAIGESKGELLNGEDIACLASSESNNLLACANSGVTLWDLQAHQKLQERLRMHESIHEVRFNQDGTLLATAPYDGLVQILDVRSGMHAVQLYSHNNNPVSSVAFHPDGVVIATASGHCVRPWDLRTGGLLSTELVTDSATLSCVRWNKNGTQLATSGNGISVKLWSMGKAGIKRYLDADLTPESAALLLSCVESIESYQEGNTEDNVYKSPGSLRILKQLPSQLAERVEDEMLPPKTAKAIMLKDRDPIQDCCEPCLPAPCGI